ncbi:MAG: gamma-glutamyl-gamma-aminobutyrate hydrolase family protein [Gemmatimonadetes bacterium]|nr:gamma-glutamyl-gamma-aminobutyrate hydrolase family protein [Gemmatimonadota bacterium]
MSSTDGDNVRARGSIRIAVTTTLEAVAGEHSRPAVFLYTSYIHALEQMGLAPVLITPAHSPAAIASLLNACCGIVLSGGEDVEPSRYGEKPSPALGATLRERDEMEFTALDCALQRDMPVFGICRGCQVLNVHFGGSLYQDIDTERPGHLLHQQLAPWGQSTHAATVRPDSLLRRIIGTDELHINSFHHQAVKELGRDLRVVARADDGLVEAIEHESRAWVLGVQWHPERGEAAAPDTDPDRRLFASFRDAVRQYADERREQVGIEAGLAR